MADSGPSRPDGDITRRSPRVPGPHTCDQGARPDCGNPAGRAVSSNRRMLFDNGIFSMARDGDPVRLVLAGELDFPHIPRLAAALLDAVDGSGVLHVDLADVYFCDLAALRTIIGLSQYSDNQPPPHRARSVVLHNLPSHIERILQILGWDTAPGLAVDTGTSATTPQ